MAFVRHFEKRPLEPTRLHGEVTCGWASTVIDGRRIVQLETYGSQERKMPGKVSQSLQFDENSARELQRILKVAFPEI